jgi:hypothetical protein
MSKMAQIDEDKSNGSGGVQLPFTIKVFLSFFIVILLTFSIWFKIDYFRDFRNNLLDNKPPSITEIESPGVDAFENREVESVENVIWLNEPYFFVSEKAYYSSSASVDVKQYFLDNENKGLVITVLPKTIHNGIKWAVGIGNFSTELTASNFIKSLGGNLINYEILSTESLIPPNIPTRKDLGTTYYSVKLGEFTQKKYLDKAFEIWSNVGFRHLEKVEIFPYKLTFGQYYFEQEAKLIADIIEKGTNSPVGVILIQREDLTHIESQ